MRVIGLRLAATVLFGVSVTAPFGGGLTACGARPDDAGSAAAQADEAVPSTGCVVNEPITADGYTAFSTVDPTLVTRKIVVNGALVQDPQATITPTSDQIATATVNINTYLATINALGDNMRRHELYSQTEINAGRGIPQPYCLFHAAGQPIYGTVILFHGMADRPHQQGKLASYLFHSGFNIYNVFLADQFIVNQNNKSVDNVQAAGGDSTALWPRLDYNPAFASQVEALVAANQTTLAPILTTLEQGTSPSNLSPAQQMTIESVLGPQLAQWTAAWANPDPSSAAFAQVFNVRNPATDGTQVAPGDDAPTRAQKMLAAAGTADFFDYVRDGAARIADIAPLGGPVFLHGLSVGGQVAFAVAENDGGANVRAVLNHSPWLQSISASNNEQLKMVGGLDQNINSVSPGNYPIVWTPHDIAFSPAAVAANLALGQWVQNNHAKIGQIPTATVMTAADDSADNTATNAFVGTLNADLTSALGGAAPATSIHQTATYPVALNVGHAMTDPENYLDGAPENWNHYFRQLYQESFRFYLTGQLAPNGLGVNPQVQDPTLPQAACVIPDFPGRCNVTN